MRVYQQGCGSIRLAKSDFLASGGEGSIFVKGDTAFKIYSDPSKMIPAGKIAELGAIDDPKVIRPEAVLLDKARGRAIGYAMRYLRDSTALCQLLTRSYRERHGIRQQDMLHLVGELAERLRSVHRGAALVVDVSEMNFLADRGLDAVYAIDADSYQTPHYPATAITLSVRDPLTADGTFSELSDWFSFAVLSFQLLVGVHPFKGKHPTVKGLSERMERHLSVFDPEVRIPKVAYPLDVIPSALRAWFEAVLQHGKRLPPPIDPGRAPTLTALPTHAAAASTPEYPGSTPGGTVELSLLHELTTTVRAVYANGRSLWAIADDGLYADGARIDAAPPAGAVLGWTATKGRVVVAARGLDGSLALRDPHGGVMLQAPTRAEALMSCDGRIYVKSAERIVEILLRDVGSSVIASAKVAASVLPHATKLFDGVAVQSLLGACYLSLFPATGRHLQLRVPELDGADVIDARCDFPVALLVVAEQGNYRRVLLRVAADGSDYDLHEESASQPAALGLVTLDSGVWVRLCEDDALEIGAARVAATGRRRVVDEALAANWLLSRQAGKVLCATGRRVYRMSTKPDGQRRKEPTCRRSAARRRSRSARR